MAKYDPNSIVDYLKSQGQDSSYSARQDLAKELGITNYKGSGEQNTQMLNMLKNGTASGSKNSGSTGSDKPSNNMDVEPTKLPYTGTGTPEATILPYTGTTPPEATPLVKGVDSSVTDKINGTFGASSNATNAQNVASSALGVLNSMGTPTVSQETMNILNSQFSASSAYNEAMNYTNALKDKLSSGRTSYTDQIQSLISQIQNRDKFSYDVDNDMLFQQALASAMGSGKQAMQDTMGQASALTGGYASTYAQGVGNQAYNAYIEDAYNNLPEYYQMAMEAYNMEGQDMYNQLSMLSDADATEYQRMYDAWNVNFTSAQNMYNQEYGAWQDSVNNAYNSANLQLQQQGMAYDQAYNTYQANQSYADTLYAQEYQRWQDEINNALAMAGMQNSDFWNKTTMENSNNQAQLDREHDSSEAQLNRDFNAGEAEKDRTFSAGEAEKDREFKAGEAEKDRTFSAEESEKDRTFKAGEADKDRTHDNAQFVARYDVNGDNKVDAEDQKVEQTKDSDIDQKHFVGALEAFNTGGISGLNQYLNSLLGTYNESELEEIADYAGEYGYDEEKPAPYTERTYKVVDDGGWHIGKLDDNAVVKDQYGNEMTIKQLYDILLEEGMSKKKAKEWLSNLQDELGI